MLTTFSGTVGGQVRQVSLYIPRAWGQVKITFIPANGKVSYAVAKGYCPIALLSFMQKMMKKFVT